MTATPTARPPVPAPTRRRGMLGGLVVIAVGATFLLPPLGVPEAVSYLFLALGVAFAVAYVQGTRPTVYLVPAAVMLAFGVGLLVPSWLGLPGGVRAAIFLAALAVGFAAVVLIHPSRRWPLWPAAVFAVIALAELLELNVVPGAAQPFLVPVILIAVGAYLIAAPRPD